MSTAIEEASRPGIDLSLIEVSLSYSYDKRAQQHQAALEPGAGVGTHRTAIAW
jgi:hypothetical protein